VEEYLTGFKGALVLISHDRAFLNRLVSRIVEVDREKVTIYSGDYDHYDGTRQMQQEVLLAAYKNQQEKVKRIQKFIDQNRVKARTASRVQSRLKMLEKIQHVEPPPKAKTLKFTFPQPARSGRRVLEIKGLVKKYGAITVYDGFDFVLDRGDRIGLVGPNGAGKSTLLKIMAGVLSFDEGTVKYGHMVAPGYFAQHQSENMNASRTVLEEAYFVSPAMPEQEVRNVLGAFLFSGDDVYKKVTVLSGGEKSRLALVKILLAPPNLLLMDEPTNHLDIPSCEILQDGLQNYQGTLVLITHDRRLMNSICTGILEIRKDGADSYPGNYDDYRYKKKIMEEQHGEAQAIQVQQDREPQPVSPRQSRKERKRREAQDRISLFRMQAPIRHEIEKLEKELQVKSARKKEIEMLMTNPAIYQDRGKIMPLLQEDPILAKEIQELEARWEELQLKLDRLENTFVAGS
jgi:ATP-binding cassette subfamily F protein 3